MGISRNQRMFEAFEAMNKNPYSDSYLASKHGNLTSQIFGGGSGGGGGGGRSGTAYRVKRLVPYLLA